MLNYLVLDSWFMISIYFNVPRSQGFPSPPRKINLNVWNDLDKSHPMTILSDPPSVGDFQTCFSPPSSLSLSLPSLSISRKGERLGDFQAESSQVFCLMVKTKTTPWKIIWVSEGDRIISTDEMFYGSKIWRHDQTRPGSSIKKRSKFHLYQL